VVTHHNLHLGNLRPIESSDQRKSTIHRRIMVLHPQRQSHPAQVAVVLLSQVVLLCAPIALAFAPTSLFQLVAPAGTSLNAQPYFADFAATKVNAEPKRIIDSIPPIHINNINNNNSNEDEDDRVGVGKTAVIAGSTGYIGRACVRECVARGYNTIALVRDVGRASSDGALDGASLVECDVTDGMEVQQILEEIALGSHNSLEQQRQQQQQQQGQITPFSSIQDTPHPPLAELGLPASISMLVQNLIECGCDNVNLSRNAYNCLETASKDLHLLLLDPSCFLFDHEPISENGRMQLLYRKHKLYGRENEVSLITDAFCRVSSGKSEALFIGGFSGVGKSELVNSLNAQVYICEGYVITHKFDQMSKQRPVLEVVSMFNDLCLLIKEKRTPQYLLAIYEELIEVFDTDFSILARLLPNIDAVSPQPNNTIHKIDSENEIDLQIIYSTLRRFMGVVSSKSHPVMIFFDDLQWCHDSALTLIENIFFDINRSGCVLFIGGYRSNQAGEDDIILSLIGRLSSSGVPTTNLSLEGLDQQDLNTMMSDAMCIFPRVCEPLSAIVYQKTKVVLYPFILHRMNHECNLTESLLSLPPSGKSIFCD